jgi:UDP-N-acetylmuramate--alanine ligase
MSALARYYHKSGWKVTGYDRAETDLTRSLVDEGIAVSYVDTVDDVDHEAALVVYTPAIPSDNVQLVFYRDKGYTVIKRSEALGALSKEQYTIAIAGTHGKTTTSSMLAYIMHEAETGVSAFLGGVLADYGSNFIAGSGDKIIVEADEYDRSFLTLRPDVAAIMSMDPDHLDIYSSHHDMLEAFKAFTDRIKRKGLLLLSDRHTHHLSRSWQNILKRKDIIGLSFGLENTANIQALNIRVEDGFTVFDYQAHENYIADFKMRLPGTHNIENALVAISIAIYEGVPVEQIAKSLASFGGIKRRWERVVESDKVVYIDDYAHHPTEVEAAITAARGLYPDRHLTVVFQPHLYSRTRDFAADFGKVLQMADTAILCDIYPAREEAIDGVTSELIASHMPGDVPCMHKDEVVDYLGKLDLDVVMTLGAGDIDTCVPLIKKMIKDGEEK